MARQSASSGADARWMRLALSLAARGLGRVAPNPTVGAVLVRAAPHAEAIALDQARDLFGTEALRGATAYVTLEPCAHHGRTPPCAEALIAARIARVVCPMIDPDPRVSGRGLAALEAAGISVETGLMQAEARRLNAGFLSRIERGRPFLTLKLAATLDGRIATRTGESRWITGPEARARVHLMRMQSDAVLIGAGTARADDPMLDVRGFGQGAAQPLRVVADGGLSLPLTGRLAMSAGDHPVAVLCRRDAPADRRAAMAGLGIEVIDTDAGTDGTLEITDAVARLASAGVTRILCEGGGRLSATLLAAGLVDEVALFSAGKVIGGDGVAAVAELGLDRLGAAPGFALESVEPIGGDVLSVWRSLPAETR